MSALAPEPGALVAGKYRVLRLLGEGGMGVVVLAVHEALGARVAIKILGDHGRSRTDERRFQLEARAAAQLRSEHVARVTDFGTLDDGRRYMVMEYLDGEDLSSYLERRGTLADDEAADLVIQACAALAEAHAVGIVHRDIKPSNLFLARRSDGEPILKVLDFGVSKFDGFGSHPSLTSAGLAVGTPLYMSPEQVNSRAIDARSDVWAMGVVLYEMLTGDSPFHDDSLGLTLLNVLERPHVPLAACLPPRPAELAAIVDACLTKDPASRLASVAELAERLAPFASADVRPLAARVRRIFDRAREERHVSIPPPEEGVGMAGPTRRMITPGQIDAATRRYTTPVTGRGGSSSKVATPLTGEKGSSDALVAPPRTRATWIGIGLAVVVVGTAGIALLVTRQTTPTTATPPSAIAATGETASTATGAVVDPPVVAPSAPASATSVHVVPVSASTTARSASVPPRHAPTSTASSASSATSAPAVATASPTATASARVRPTLH